MLRSLFTRRKRRYNFERNWRYHHALRSCQKCGRRIGTVSRTNGIWVLYLLDGKAWRFRHGRVVGPIDPSSLKHLLLPQQGEAKHGKN